MPLENENNSSNPDSNSNLNNNRQTVIGNEPGYRVMLSGCPDDDFPRFHGSLWGGGFGLGRQYQGALTASLVNYIQSMRSNTTNRTLISVLPQLVKTNPIVERLKKIGFNLDDFPAKYLDPISLLPMCEPVTAVTETEVADNKEASTSQQPKTKTIRRERTYDKSTCVKLNNQCPETRLTFKEVKGNTLLKAEIEAYVASKEAEYAQRTQSTSTASTSTAPKENDKKRNPEDEDQEKKVKKAKP